MGILKNLRGSRAGTTQEGLPVSNGVSTVNKKKWSNLMPLFVALVVIAEISFLGRLDMAKNAALVDSWTDLFFRTTQPVHEVSPAVDSLTGLRSGESESCEDWLKREDAVEYSRDFAKEPILVSGGEQVRTNLIIIIIISFLSIMMQFVGLINHTLILGF